MGKKKTICRFKSGDIVQIRRGAWFSESGCFEAKVMAIADGYAMLRRKGCSPFVESITDLEKWNPSSADN
jgi:hypothetical protein